MDFWPNYVRWVRILYPNRYLSRTFSTIRGVCQGCTFSKKRYDVFEETIAEDIRSYVEIKGGGDRALATFYSICR